MSSSWTPPGFSGKKRFGILRPRAAIAALCAFLLSSCGPPPPVPIPLSSKNETPAPPGSDAKPVLPGQSGKGSLPNGMPDLEPHGVKIEELFAPDIRDPIERVKRVENAVIELRHDFDAVMPSIIRLVEIEKDIQSLTSQLDTLVGGGEAPAMPAPEVAEAEPLPDTSGESAVSAAPLNPADTAAAPDEAPAAPELPPQKTEGPAQSASVQPRTEALAPPEALQPAPAQEPAPTPPVSDPVAPAAQPPPPQGPPPRASPVQQSPPDAAPPAKKPASAGTGVFVTGLRLGDHGGSVRAVLDISGSTAYRREIDNTEKLMVIELPEAGWDTSLSKTFASNPLVASYEAQPMENGKGTRLILQLKAPTSVASETTLNPDGTSGHRIVLDLKK